MSTRFGRWPQSPAPTCLPVWFWAGRFVRSSPVQQQQEQPRQGRHELLLSPLLSEMRNRPKWRSPAET
ncbi:hypothetical protein GOODEAATRI_018062 [Goodea atripinnis]|uniref:Secreted protein n=1 Tax=Goodea atripinnis TaxID=208336 RepID=A0ABV0NVJ8_9TELE